MGRGIRCAQRPTSAASGRAPLTSSATVSTWAHELVPQDGCAQVAAFPSHALNPKNHRSREKWDYLALKREDACACEASLAS
jgi:hypothetical protein